MSRAKIPVETPSAGWHVNRHAHILGTMTIVTYYHNPKRARKVKPAQQFPAGRVVTAKKPKPRHYGEIREGAPDEAERTELARQFIERTLKGE